MKYVPRKYQEFTTNKIINSTEVGAFLDMGLGKTAAALTGILELKKRKQADKILVIAPKKVAESVWPGEIEKWNHLRGLTHSLVLGTEKDRRLALKADADIYIINRENVVWLVALFGCNWPFDTVIIDELSSFKSPKSQRFKSLRLVRKYMRRVIGLTGTPAPNGLLDLWSQLYLLDLGRSLGASYGRYKDTYFSPGRRNGHIVFNYDLKKGGPLLGEDFYRKEIYQKVGDVCFSMSTQDYLSLPAFIDNDQKIILPSVMKTRYDDFEREKVMELADKEITAVNAAALMSKLLQYANGAVYDEKKGWHLVHDEKITKLKEIVEALAGRPLFVFYQFISDKERILNAFPEARLLTDNQSISDWNLGKIPILLAHPLSAGHGLNLQFGGSNMLWFSLPWSLEQYQGGTKRLHRHGASSAVVNTRLIVEGTVDEDVLKTLRGKGHTQNAVIEAVKARMLKYC